MVACARPDLQREDELLVDQQTEENENDPSMVATTENANDNNNNNDTQQANNDWPTAEGYTPLGDVTAFGSNVMFAMPPSSLEDDGDDNFGANNAMYSSGPNQHTFVADPAALFHPSAFPQEDGQEDNDANEDNEEEGRTESSQENLSSGVGDYRDVACVALLALDEDYQMTLRGEVRSSPLDERPRIAPAMPMFDSSSFSNNLQPTNNETENFADFSSPDASISPSSARAPMEDSSSRSQGQSQRTSSAKNVPNIDTDAVKKAVAGILSNSTDKFADKMKKWQEEKNVVATQARQSRSTQHSVILAAPLKAFQKETPKAIQATANLTRSATIGEVLHRLSSLLKSQDCLSIHVVGADHVECESEDRIRAHFGPLARWIGANIYSPKHLSLSLVGPNVPTSMTVLSTPTNLLEPPQNQQLLRLHSATAKCFEASYHDWLKEQQSKEEQQPGNGNLPDVLICFNAGIWGYDEWKPTIRSIIHLKRHIPFIVTSYTVFEAEDDFDVIDEVFKSVTGKDEHSKTTSSSEQGCLWEPEENFFASKQKRETVTAVQDRVYRENATWQAWRF